MSAANAGDESPRISLSLIRATYAKIGRFTPPCRGSHHATEGSRDRGPNSDHELPMTMPAMNTSAPPTMTWNAALRKGVSM
jgi:hypothetical protein